MAYRRHKLKGTGAFTLVEILIVVVVLGILAAIVVPQFSNASQDAAAVTLQSQLATIKAQLDYQFQASGTGTYPAAIDPTWFASNQLPQHPQNNVGIPAFQIDNTAGKLHPFAKVLTASMPGAFWYDPKTGIVRARVSDQGSSSATLDFYNRVNDSNESALGNYPGGGGS